MKQRPHVSNYLTSWQKRAFDVVVGLFLLVVGLPLLLCLSLLIYLVAGRPVFFFQRRMGKNGKPFWMYKFRTMYVGSDEKQKEYLHLNEADGPVFKIRNDPRFVGVGKWLARTGLDELPQLVNVLKGEMSLVGPRPLPDREAIKIEKVYPWRELVRPGIVSSWVVNGSHKLTFDEWMRLDREYVESATFSVDMSILWKTFRLLLRGLIYK